TVRVEEVEPRERLPALASAAQRNCGLTISCSAIVVASRASVSPPPRDVPASRLFVPAQHEDATVEAPDPEEERARLLPAIEDRYDLDRLPLQVEAPRRFVPPIAGMALYPDLAHPCENAYL